jgi:hypothetical protein
MNLKESFDLCIDNEMVFEEDLKYEHNLLHRSNMNLENLNSQLMLLETSGLSHYEQRLKIYELQLPFLNEVHSNVVYGIIKEALAQDMLTDEESLEAA